MQIYLVGGAVRDQLLGEAAVDRDYVVVGSTAAEMWDAGFLTVGLDFPVFLHPVIREEYALARAQRWAASSFSQTVTLEEDLWRRDLTINAMAQDDSGLVIDPYNGQYDIVRRLLRHVSDSFREDPIRILRVARLGARYTDFTVAPETMALMREMVAAGEVDHLAPERAWKELSRGLMEGKPSRMFELLRECGALARILPELEALWGIPQPEAHHPEIDTGVHVMMVLDMTARLNAPLPVRFAAMCHDLGKGTTPADILPKHHKHELRSYDLLKPVCRRLKVPNECRAVAELVAREHGNVHASLGFGSAALARLLQRCGAIRHPARFAEVLLACECDARGRLGLEERPHPQRERLTAALALASAVDTAAVAQKLMELRQSGPELGEGIYGARVVAIAAGFDALPHPPVVPAAAPRQQAAHPRFKP